MLQTILFDFDGVILESVGIKGQGFARLYAHLGPDVESYVQSYHHYHGGVSRTEKIRHFNARFGLPQDQATIDQFCAQFSKLILDGIKSCPFVPGAKEFLIKYSQKYPLFVISATPQEDLHEIMKLRHLSQYFQGAWGSPSSKKVHIEDLLSSKKWSPREVIFVGDALADLQAAQSTGIHFLGRVISDEDDIFPPSTKVSTNLFSDLEKMILSYQE